MKRTYVPFHYNKTDNITLYYDFEAKQFFTSPGARPNPYVATFSGTAGVIINALFQNMVINTFGHNPLIVVSFSLIMSLLLALGAMWVIHYFMERNWDKVNFVDNPSKKEMPIYIQEGEKWLKSGLFMTFYLFLFTLMGLFFFLFNSNNAILFFSNTVLWATIIFMIWALRPLKRRTIYKQFKETLEHEQEMI